MVFVLLKKQCTPRHHYQNGRL